MLYSIDFRLTYRIALYCDLYISYTPGLGTNATETRADLPLFLRVLLPPGLAIGLLSRLGWRINFPICISYSVDAYIWLIVII